MMKSYIYAYHDNFDGATYVGSFEAENLAQAKKKAKVMSGANDFEEVYIFESRSGEFPYHFHY